MGDRYVVTANCPECGGEDEGVFYAPTCGFSTHECSVCGFEIDLEKCIGITHEDASNLEEIQSVLDKYCREAKG